ncbi:MAG: GOLPH3/VPS74 family protein [Nocardioidaceae bacterium]
MSLPCGHDDRNARARPTDPADVVVSGALLADLAEAGCLVETDKLVSVAPDASVDGPPILVEALDVLRQRDQPVKAKKLLEDLRKQLNPVSDRVAERLVELGVLELGKATFLKIPLGYKAPTLDPEPERALRTRLGDILVQGVTPSDRDAELIALLRAADLIRHVVDKEHRKAAKQRAQEIEAQGPASPALKAVVDEVNDALVMAIAAGSAAGVIGSS